MLRALFFVFFLFWPPTECFAAKRDFKGLFGSYRRERFIENEARSSDFGMDFMLSTLMPISPIVSSQETTNGSFEPLYYAAFFNAEMSFLFSINYHFETFLNVGYYGYETRKENKAINDQQPLNPRFHAFELTAVPIILGLRYRLSTEDLVPYLGAGLGMTHVRQKASYLQDSTTRDEKELNAITGELMVGCEFYFSSRAGVRLEIAGYLFNFPGDTFTPGSGTPEVLPNFQYTQSPILIRYASGLFWLF